MPNPPIILPIAPSNWQRAGDVGLCAGGVLLAAWYLEAVAVIVAASMALGFLGWRVFCGWPWPQSLSRTLWVVERGGNVQGYWVHASGEVGHTQDLRCDYLGPWLLRLNVGGERLWLWPDSAPGDAQRQLRRLLLYVTQR